MVPAADPAEGPDTERADERRSQEGLPEPDRLAGSGDVLRGRKLLPGMAGEELLNYRERHELQLELGDLLGAVAGRHRYLPRHAALGPALDHRDGVLRLAHRARPRLGGGGPAH